MNTNVMTVQDVADFFKVSKITVYKLAHQRKLPGVRVGNSWRFNRSKIEAMARRKA